VGREGGGADDLTLCTSVPGCIYGRLGVGVLVCLDGRQGVGVLAYLDGWLGVNVFPLTAQEKGKQLL